MPENPYSGIWPFLGIHTLKAAVAIQITMKHTIKSLFLGADTNREWLSFMIIENQAWIVISYSWSFRAIQEVVPLITRSHI